MRIGVDLMGSDSSPEVLFKAACLAAEELDSKSSLVVIGTYPALRQLKSLGPIPSLIEFHVVTDAINMADEPIKAITHKKGSSLLVGIRLLKKRYLDAFVTAGNTGALLTGATLNLPRLPGIKRPALLVTLPTINGPVAVLDVGGSVSCKPAHLLQFAQMGAAYQSCCYGVERPVVGLLNIGVEPKKGSSIVRQTYIALEEAQKDSRAPLSFFGNIEGREVFQGEIDVLVTDGFTGNVLLKTTEGVSSFIFDYIQETIRTTSEEGLQGVLRDLKKFFNHAEYPGAFLCGVEGVVIKCHGNSSTKAMLSGIRGAIRCVEVELIPKLKERLQLLQT